MDNRVKSRLSRRVEVLCESVLTHGEVGDVVRGAEVVESLLRKLLGVTPVRILMPLMSHWQ